MSHMPVQSELNETSDSIPEVVKSREIQAGSIRASPG